MSATSPSIRERILGAAFDAFMRLGYGGTSTARIARIARVSKRDLYAHFGSKQAMLAACVAERAERMRRPLTLPSPIDRDSLHRILIQFGIAVVRELGSPEVLATFRLAIVEAENAPDVGIMLDRQGRAGNTSSLIALLAAAQERGLLGAGEPDAMADLFLGVLLSGGILVRMLMRVMAPLTEAAARDRAELAAECLLRLHGRSG